MQYGNSSHKSAQSLSAYVKCPALGRTMMDTLMMRIACIILAALLHTAVLADEHESAQEPLRFIVYGASGNVGSRVASEALDRGHHVTAVSRNPSRIKNLHDNIVIVKGDILDVQSVAGLVTDHDVVVVSVKGSADGSKNPEQAVHRVAADVLVATLRGMGESAPRLIYVGGAGSLEVEPGVLYADTVKFVPKSIRQEINGHVLTLEYLRTIEDVSWTYISPAKKFKKGKRTGEYRIGGDQMLLDEKGRSRISMEDFAVALVDEAENSDFIGGRFSVAY